MSGDEDFLGRRLGQGTEADSSDGGRAACAAHRRQRGGRCRHPVFERHHNDLLWRERYAGVIDEEGGQTCRSTETQLSWKDGITGKVADSDKLDGKDSSKFARAALFGSAVNGRNGESANSNCVVGEVRLFAGSVTPGGWKMARGQVLEISQYEELHTLVGSDYGGNGQTTFALPDFRGAEPKGAGPAAPYYAICTQGIYPH